MKTHRWILHVMQARTLPVEGSPDALRTDPLARAARRILVLVLVLGSLGTSAAASYGHDSAGHASANKPAGNIHLAVSAYPASPRQINDVPWMY